MSDFINIYANGSAGNHGCEALTRSLYKILSPVGKIKFYSLNREEDYHYGLGDLTAIDSLIPKVHHSWLKYQVYRIKQHFNYSDARHFKLLYEEFVKRVNPEEVYLSAGGDNYSYGNNTWLECLNEGINNRGGRTALIGCSILEQIKDKRMIADLSRYHTIIARESISFEALMNAGVRSNIMLCPDPAFQLDCSFLSLPNGFQEKNTVGINVSPMVIGRELSNGILLSNYIELVKYILATTDMQIALIPHVVWSHTDDRKPLLSLYEMFRETNRVVMIKDHNAEELKGFIARCRFMVAARTHASIAAYSQSVPTLVVGYSVKSKGIAKDIFGDYKGYVVNIEDIKSKTDLARAFSEIQNREEHIKNIYSVKMPEYSKRALQIAPIIDRIRQ